MNQRLNRRHFLEAVSGASVLAAVPASLAPAAAGTAPLPLLASDGVVVYDSPDAANVYAYSPGIVTLPGGRLVATMDQGGPGATDDPAVAGSLKLRRTSTGKVCAGLVFTSDDQGRSWQRRADTPLVHARPFPAGDSVYVLGHQGDLGIVRSGDGGTTWGEASWLSEGQKWHQAPSNVHYANGKVYLVMERVMPRPTPFWPVGVMAPVVMSARVEDDLTRRESWTFSNELTFDQAIAEAGKPHLSGVPFFPTGYLTDPAAPVKRAMAPIGWLETHIVQFTDPNHVWHDPKHRTLHLWLRAHTGTTNLAAIAKAVEADDGSITVTTEQAPSGEPMVFVPCPGGHLKFHILHDDVSGLFWLVSNQSTDSMTRPDRLPENRFDLPNNERHRLVLHFSKNCVDWCFAGRVADTGNAGQSRNYPSMCIDGEDLHILSRSGDARANSAHNGNLITFHTISDFRRLAY